MSLLLIASAITAFAALAVCAIVMLRNQDNRYDNFGQVTPLALVGIIVALGLLLALGGGRFWLEATLRLPSPA